MPLLPPLNGLRAFEAAARCGSFVLAGQELGVSSAAVSLQVKNLEAHLGKKLFVRSGNRISLTDAGENIYPTIARAFAQISESAQFVRGSRRARQLTISTLPSLSELWLLPKTLDFRKKHKIPVEIRVQQDPIDFTRDSIDIRFTYGSTFYSDHKEIILFRDEAIPVCSPAIWERYRDPHRTLERVPDAFLIHNKWGPSYSSEPSWKEWRAKAQLKAPEFTDSGLVISDTSLAISAAKKGAGFALVPSTLVRCDLATGSLLAPSKISIPMKKDYVCVFPERSRRIPHIATVPEFPASELNFPRTTQAHCNTYSAKTKVWLRKQPFETFLFQNINSSF